MVETFSSTFEIASKRSHSLSAAALARRSWRPILEGEVKGLALTAVEEIIAALPDQSVDASLAEGAAGSTVLFAYLDRAGYGTAQNAAHFLEQAFAAVSSQSMGPSLYGGFTGVAWVTTHLREQLIDPDDGDPCEAIDEALRDYLKLSPWPDNYDLVSGLVGVGVYALERLPRPAAVECLNLIVDHLGKSAESRDGSGLTWHTPSDLLPEWQRELFPNGYYNLGLAHGVPGVVVLLAAAHAAGVAKERTKTLLDGAVRWLMNKKLAPGAGSTFPKWVGRGIEPRASRLGWCYGDLSIATALLCAARCVGEPAWESVALDIALRAAQRPPEESGVVDAGLCHGAVGVGHICNRMFQATGETRFREAAQSWFENALDMRRVGQGIAGFSAFRRDDDGKECWIGQRGILTGVTGIALALLAATTDIDPQWDRMLLLSIAVRLGTDA